MKTQQPKILSANLKCVIRNKLIARLGTGGLPVYIIYFKMGVANFIQAPWP